MEITDTAAANVARMAGAEPDFVLHAGDPSYANGDKEGWDEWVRQIELLAAKAPYMPAPGSHEY
jgi:phosphodiesterase/alkaline phosphatase D-like protein